jgi:hypothetical protein
MARTSDNITVKLPHLEREFGKQLDEELKRVSAPVRFLLQKEARTNHRYTKRNKSKPRPHLEESTVATGSFGKKIKGKRTITLQAKAKHAKFIIGGFKSWAPDKFLTKAVSSKGRQVYQMLRVAISKATKKVNS